MRNEGTLYERYTIYVEGADDGHGHGRDMFTGGKEYLKTFHQWLDDQPGDPVEESQ